MQNLDLNDDGLYYPVFPKDWHRSKLYKLATWVNGIAFKDINGDEHGLPVIKIAEIKNGLTDQTKYTNQLFDQSVLVTTGDLLFSWSGQPETSIDANWWRGPNGWLNQHIFRVSVTSTIDDVFFYYILKYLKPNFIGIAKNKQTTGLGHVTKKDLERIEVAYPSLPEQRRIALILGTLDDKIENNRKTAKTLEAMAQAIFQSWFVDFDPVRAKMAGESPESICKRLKLTPEILDLFPDRLVDSELGEIPEGWEVKPLGDLLELAYGKPLKAENRTNGNVPVYGSNGLIGWHDEKLIDGPGIVVGRKGNPGTVTWVESSFYPIDTTFYVISINRVGLRFLYHALMCHDLTSLGADSAVPGLNRNLAYISKQLVPHDSLDSVFENLTEKLFLSSHNLNKQSMDGTEIRDILLPKLISGEIRVPEAEHLIENMEG